MKSLKKIASAISPKPSLEYFVYRAPFYLNMISVGYIWYFCWMNGTAAFDDKSGRMGIALVVAVFTYLTALIEAATSFNKWRESDRAGLYYLVIVLVVSVATFLVQGWSEIGLGPTV